MQAAEETLTALKDHNYLDNSQDNEDAMIAVVEHTLENQITADDKNFNYDQEPVAEENVRDNPSVYNDENGFSNEGSGTVIFDGLVHDNTFNNSVFIEPSIEADNHQIPVEDAEPKRSKKPNTSKWARI